MQSENSFRELLKRVRQGDQAAAEQLLRQYESELRIMARVRLKSTSLRRVVDSMDICQSVMRSFFHRASNGEFKIDNAEQLKKLLLTMLINKVRDQERRQNAVRRDIRRLVSMSVDDLNLSSSEESPSQIVMAREAQQEFDRRLSNDERELIQLRRGGLSWLEISQQLGSTPDALRKRYTRIVERVVKDMGIGPPE